MTTESDRELLELAAKAAGLSIDNDDNGNPVRVEWFRGNLRNEFPWDPLNNDDDAFRLEADLRLDTTWGTASVTVGGCTERYSHGDDPRAAKRRAITRAAASIGRGEG